MAEVRLVACIAQCHGRRKDVPLQGWLRWLWQNNSGCRVRCALLGCRLDGTWSRVGIDGDEVVEVEAASRISRAMRVSEVGVSRKRVLAMGGRGSVV